MFEKKTCFSRSVFRSVNDWNDVKDKLKIFCANHFAQHEARERELVIVSEQNKDNCTDADNNEQNNLSIEGEDDNRFTFVRSIP